MNIKTNFPLSKCLILLFLGVVLAACDKITETTSGGGGEGAEKISVASVESSESSTDESTEAAAPVEEEPEPPQSKNSVVQLKSFNDFRCTSNWKNRDGALGLKVGSRKGTCTASFPGGPGMYRMELIAQTEREGRSPYRISVNGNPAASGKMPFAYGKPICERCKDPWQVTCPDINMNLDAGTHQFNTGDVIEFYGEEEYVCNKHGAYSKWHGLVFTPVN